MNRSKKNMRIAISCFGLLGFTLAACSGSDSQSITAAGIEHGEESASEAKGPNGGRLLSSGDFTLELAIFERGVPPEFRAWASKGGRSLPPTEVALQVKLVRLGGGIDEISFSPQGKFLRGDTVVYEPHSFEVSIAAIHDGDKHVFDYQSFEGRTRIDEEIAKALGLTVEVAGPAVLQDRVTVYGRIRANAEQVREIRARFDGVVRKVHARVGSTVTRGEKLLTVESDESLNSYTITSPIHGVVTQRDVNPGEQTGGRLLMNIINTSSVWAELSVFPGERKSVRVGNPVSITPATGGSPFSGIISTLGVLASEDQSILARVVLDNPDGELVPGTFVTAAVTVGEHEVPLAVKRVGLQAFRDFTVVYVKVGDEYEVRMLSIGREAGEYAEVLGGLAPGTRYVAENSYIVKADIEKSGASHDH